VGGDVFDESDFVEHHNLWDEGNWLKPETVTPHKFPALIASVDQ
jgi:hypothetical protein